MLSNEVTLTLTLMIQDSGPSNHRTMFRFSKLKLIGLGGMGMVPIRSFVTKTGIGLGGAKLNLQSLEQKHCIIMRVIISATILRHH